MSPERIIDPDESRRIDLPGVGPCPRPVDIDRGVTGFKALKSLRIYRFKPGAPIHGDSEEDEVFITALDGRLTLEIAGPHPLQAELAAGQAVYMTPLHSYVLTPQTPTLVAYARAEAEGRVASQPVSGFRSDLGEHLRWQLAHLAAWEEVTLGARGQETLVHVAQGAATSGAIRLRQGQTLTLTEPLVLTASTPTELLILSV